MNCTRLILFALLALAFLATDIPAVAQFSGARGGIYQNREMELAGQPAALASGSPEIIQGFIRVSGTAEMRVAATSIRIILAISAENETSEAARLEIDNKVADLRKKVIELGVESKNYVEDFIAVLPRYKFEIENREGVKTSVEKRSGYVMQTNLHISVKDDDQALAVLKAAFAQGVNDVIGFEYGNDQIEKLKKQARLQAVTAAKENADLLLAVFDKRPPIINIAESSRVVFPDSLYQSFTNSQDDQFHAPSGQPNGLAVLRTFRPKNTYYKGFFSNGDVLPKTQPMKSEISIVSTVNLYFESPVAKEYLQLKKSEK